MTGIGSMMDLALTAISTYDFVYSLLAPDENAQIDADGNRKATLWDSLMAQLVPPVMSNLSAPILAAAVTGDSKSGKDGHHTIPKYMCGHPQQKLSYIPKILHTEIHTQLYTFDEAITVTGVVNNVLFRKKKILEFKSPVKRLGQTAVGRAAIVERLKFFYGDRGYDSQGSPSIGAALTVESLRFIGSHHTCK